MKCMWAILCERISIDQETNLVSYLTCVEGVVTIGLPLNIRNLSFGSTWLKEKLGTEIFAVRFSIVKPNGSRQVIKVTDPIETNKDNYRLNIFLDGMKLNEAGVFFFKLDMQDGDNWIEVASVPLNVKLVTPEAVNVKKVD